MKLNFVLILLGSSVFLTQNLTAAQALAVASNGKWAIAYDRTTDVAAVSANAIAKCKAKGGADAKVVYSNWQNAHGAIAVSDGGAGKVVGWSMGIGGRQNSKYNNMGDPTKHAEQGALADCQKKGGQNPKIVTSW